MKSSYSIDAQRKHQQRIGAAIRTARLRLALSQENFAPRIRMHRTYFSAVERGEKNLTLDTLCRIAAGLKVAPSDLLRSAD